MQGFRKSGSLYLRALQTPYHGILVINEDECETLRTRKIRMIFHDIYDQIFY